MEYQIIINQLDTASDNVPIFITKKWIDVHDQSCRRFRSCNAYVQFDWV